jgi:hypothetical protein
MAASKTPAEFTEEIASTYRDRMNEAVDEHYNEEYFDRLGGPDEAIKKEFPHTAWRELFIGCLPANRQVHLIYEQGDPYYEDRDLIAGLLKQVRDEVKHARVFSNYSKQFDVEADLVTWTPDHYEALVKQCRVAVEWDKPHYIAAGFQCSTEIMAAFMITNLANYIEDEYPNIARSLRDIATDEGDHVHVGSKTMARFASPEDYDKMEEIAQQKYDAAIDVLEAL